MGPMFGVLMRLQDPPRPRATVRNRSVLFVMYDSRRYRYNRSGPGLSIVGLFNCRLYEEGDGAEGSLWPTK